MPFAALLTLVALPAGTIQGSLVACGARAGVTACDAPASPAVARSPDGIWVEGESGKPPVVGPRRSVGAIEPAQVSPLVLPVQSDSSLDRAIARLSRGQRLRVSTAAGWMVSGAYVRADTAFVVVEDQTERAILRSSIREVWAQTRDTRGAATTGAMVGGLLGGALGVVGGLYCGSQCSTHEGIKDVMAPGAIGLFVGAAAGALLGAVIGSSSPRWDKLYP